MKNYIAKQLSDVFPEAIEGWSYKDIPGEQGKLFGVIQYDGPSWTEAEKAVSKLARYKNFRKIPIVLNICSTSKHVLLFYDRKEVEFFCWLQDAFACVELLAKKAIFSKKLYDVIINEQLIIARSTYCERLLNKTEAEIEWLLKLETA